MICNLFFEKCQYVIKSFVYLQKNIIHHENEKRYTKQANNGDIVHLFDVLGVHIYKLWASLKNDTTE